MSQSTIKNDLPNVDCPVCGAPMVLRQSEKYPGPFWGCSRFPNCRATHGAHPDGMPLGKPADIQTKNARIAAHAVFDVLWKSGYMERNETYAWLAKCMGIQRKDCHIGSFNNEQCCQVLNIVTNFIGATLKMLKSAK